MCIRVLVCTKYGGKQLYPPASAHSAQGQVAGRVGRDKGLTCVFLKKKFNEADFEDLTGFTPCCLNWAASGPAGRKERGGAVQDRMKDFRGPSEQEHGR